MATVFHTDKGKKAVTDTGKRVVYKDSDETFTSDMLGVIIVQFIREKWMFQLVNHLSY